MVEYHPVSAKDLSRLHQFGPKFLPGIFLGHVIIRGRNLAARLIGWMCCRRSRNWVVLARLMAGAFCQRTWMQVASLIRTRCWTRYGWSGTLVMTARLSGWTSLLERTIERFVNSVGLWKRPGFQAKADCWRIGLSCAGFVVSVFEYRNSRLWCESRILSVGAAPVIELRRLRREAINKITP